MIIIAALLLSIPLFDIAEALKEISKKIKS
jgi:hypothetical protein